jgi:late competence protein required for DNA uptake (superfamily II DNA/RNA helicase)
MSTGDILDANAKLPNMFNGKSLGDVYKSGSKIWGNLPVYCNKTKLDEIVESLEKNQVTIVSSGTGSGKTVIIPKLCVKILKSRQIPLKVGVTNPKTTTTISNATKSAEWAEVTVGNEIGYMTKQEKKISYLTVLEYMTDGFLLGLSMSDTVLSKYGFICLDEVHERPVPTDFLILRIRTALMKRKDLRLVIMSATIKEELFYNYFSSKGISTAFIGVSGQPNKPIKELYMSETPTDYIKAAADVVDKIIEKKPNASILVFVATTKDCIDGCRALKSKNNCYKLFSKAAETEKELAIAMSNDGSAKVVFATNLAESSITFSGLDYVIDSGKSLTVRWDASKNLRINKKDWISKAETKQRAGRVGREKEGTVFHLYTKKFFEEGKDKKGNPIFPDMPDPRINEINPAEELLKLASSEQHNGSWTGAMRDALELISPPTKEQIKITQDMLSFYRIIGPVVSGGESPPTDLASKNKAPKVTNVWRMGAVGWAIHDIMRVFRTSLQNSIFVLAGLLYGSFVEVLKVVAILEETDGDLNMLWKTDENGKPMSVMRDERVSNARSDHITLVNIFDSFGFIEADFRMVPKIRDRYVKMIEQVRDFTVNRREEILQNWPWCIANRELTNPEQQFGVAILISRLFNAGKVNKEGKVKALYIEGLLSNIDLKGVKEGDVVVCENFTSLAGKVTCVVPTAFAANVRLECAPVAKKVAK